MFFFSQRAIITRDSYEIINVNATSSTYMVEFMNIWHARLGYVSAPCIKNKNAIFRFNF